MYAMDLENLEVYVLARGLSDKAWEIYRRWNQEAKHLWGQQFLEAVDSIGANIAEGFGRYHYADKNKFNLNARGSLVEARHWVDLCLSRRSISADEHQKFCDGLNRLGIKLNNYITATRKLSGAKLRRISTRFLLIAAALTPVIHDGGALYPYIFPKTVFFRILMELALVLFAVLNIQSLISNIRSPIRWVALRSPLAIALGAFFLVSALSLIPAAG